MEIKIKQDALSAARAAITQHGNSPAELISILNDINHELGYLPDTALAEVGRLMQIPRSKLYSVASFYSMFSMTPRGSHIVQFCESAPCHVVGGREVWQALQAELCLKSGETSKDGKWTLVTTSCLGVCAVGPVIIVDDDIFGNVTPDQVAGILARYQ
jgi:NADH:ubiquinone oxidoreductase subunit E